MTAINLSGKQADFSALQQALIEDLDTRDAWKGALQTQTGQTLIDQSASIGAFAQMQALRYFQDSFQSTAVSPRALYAMVDEAGVRLARKTPAQITVRVSYAPQAGDPPTYSIPAFTQFSGASTFWTNDNAITIEAGNSREVTFHQGYVSSFKQNGPGTNNSMMLSLEDRFAVSDRAEHVQVFNGTTAIPRTTDPLWLKKGMPAFQDRTDPDGRLRILFGSASGNVSYGYVPATTDTVHIRYVVTSGSLGNALVTNNVRLTPVSALSAGLSFLAVSNPSGGADELPAITYRGAQASSFGTFGSAVTRTQYLATAKNYPGIADVRTYSQRELNPADLKLMNAIRVVPLTTSPWTAAQKQAYLNTIEAASMYAAKMYWQDPIGVPRNFQVIVYCRSSVNAAQAAADARDALLALFAVKPGHLGRDIFLYDCHAAIKASNPGIEAADIISPTDDMSVSGLAPRAPTLTAAGIAGTLPPTTYTYGIIATDANGDIPAQLFASVTLTATGGVKINWDAYPNAQAYKIVGRTGNVNVLATISASAPREWIDNGSAVPATTPLPTLADYPVLYNTLGSLVVTGEYMNR